MSTISAAMAIIYTQVSEFRLRSSGSTAIRCECPKGMNATVRRLVKQIEKESGTEESNEDILLRYLLGIRERRVIPENQVELKKYLFLPKKYLKRVVKSLPAEIRSLPIEDQKEIVAVLMAILHTESCYDRVCKSNRDAYGIMQVKLDAAQEVYPEVRKPEELYNYRINIRAGTRYFAKLMNFYYDHYDVSSVDPLTFAVVAYNKGPKGAAGELLNYSNRNEVAASIQYAKKVFPKAYLYLNLYDTEITEALAEGK